MAYQTKTHHTKLYPYTSVMASPYSCDPTGVIDIAAAIEQIKANQSNIGTIYFPHGTWKVATNLTIPSTMHLAAEKGANLVYSATLTLNCTIDENINFTASGSGTLVIGSSSSAPDIYASSFGIPSWTNLQTVIAVANTSGRRLVLTPGTWPVTDDIVITAPVYHVPIGIFQVATAKTLTISGSFEAGLYQAFSCTGTGKAVFGVNTVKEVFPYWFGANGLLGTDQTAALNSTYQSQLTTGNVTFGPGTFKTTGNTITGDSTNWRKLNFRGAGSKTLLYNTGGAVVLSIDHATSNIGYEPGIMPAFISDMRMSGASAASAGAVLKLRGCGHYNLQRLLLENAQYGIHLLGSLWTNIELVNLIDAGFYIQYDTPYIMSNNQTHVNLMHYKSTDNAWDWNNVEVGSIMNTTVEEVDIHAGSVSDIMKFTNCGEITIKNFYAEKFYPKSGGSFFNLTGVTGFRAVNGIFSLGISGAYPGFTSAEYFVNAADSTDNFNTNMEFDGCCFTGQPPSLNNSSGVIVWRNCRGTMAGCAGPYQTYSPQMMSNKGATTYADWIALRCSLYQPVTKTDGLVHTNLVASHSDFDAGVIGDYLVADAGGPTLTLEVAGGCTTAGCVSIEAGLTTASAYFKAAFLNGTTAPTAKVVMTQMMMKADSQCDVNIQYQIGAFRGYKTVRLFSNYQQIFLVTNGPVTSVSAPQIYIQVPAGHKVYIDDMDHWQISNYTPSQIDDFKYTSVA